MGLLFTDTDTYDNFRKNKEIFDLSNYSAKSRHYSDSNALVVDKMKYEMGGVAIE